MITAQRPLGRREENEVGFKTNFTSILLNLTRSRRLTLVELVKICGSKSGMETHWGKILGSSEAGCQTQLIQGLGTKGFPPSHKDHRSAERRNYSLTKATRPGRLRLQRSRISSNLTFLRLLDAGTHGHKVGNAYEGGSVFPSRTGPE